MHQHFLLVFGTIHWCYLGICTFLKTKRIVPCSLILILLSYTSDIQILVFFRIRHSCCCRLRTRDRWRLFGNLRFVEAIAKAFFYLFCKMLAWNRIHWKRAVLGEHYKQNFPIIRMNFTFLILNIQYCRKYIHFLIFFHWLTGVVLQYGWLTILFMVNIQLSTPKKIFKFNK